jgi:hypothetical protein
MGAALHGFSTHGLGKGAALEMLAAMLLGI